ncbi:N-acetyl-gamma-glutamyl-phosphate reductase [Paenibacillus sp. CF384]|uniref:N-acetyl-gamma-glutamyl-phosphate reductase n=1 Tax=Paenibacillus sp. CF384 TaxID=1884382 RepID=UPI00089BDEE1|nr:N-acetyl-gamma-glutamyl-phosphate reductase [Paenibacillus sp. CF384]SDX28963.1 N-acetyl-gamma-glutamyl-phosphate reductase [Paenibacillus sp. CF384]
MSKAVKAAIIGSTGYGGVELIRLLAHHPQVEVTSVISSSSAGAPIAEGFPHLTEICTDILDDVDPALIRSKAEVVFIATPPGIAARLIPSLLAEGLKVIDISGDHRLKSRSEYETWYKKEPAEQQYLDQAVYGLCEVYGDAVQGVDLISNPGCFPTSALLGLIPAVQEGYIDHSTIIIDAKSGVSGAGRGTSVGNHYPEINENFKAYKINKHQHIPEIEQVLSDVAGEKVLTTFTTHLVPMTRGIMSTIYATVKDGHSVEDFIALYSNYYEGRKFVRIRKNGTWPATKEVSGSNYCDIGFSVDERTGRITIVSVIDNLVKGAAGQAIQNLNLMMGWDEALGLNFVPMYP